MGHQNSSISYVYTAYTVYYICISDHFCVLLQLCASAITQSLISTMAITMGIFAGGLLQLICSLVLFPSSENLRIIFPIVILCPPCLYYQSALPQHPCSYHPAELLTQTYKQINTKYVYHTISLYEHYVYIYTYIFSLDITCMFLEYIGQVLRSRARTCERWHCN